MLNNLNNLTMILTIVIIVIVILLAILCMVYFMSKSKDKKKKEKVINSAAGENAETLKSKTFAVESVFDFMEFDKIEDNMICQKKRCKIHYGSRVPRY